ncbi:Polycomb group RING finger protein 1 [Mactra antiquata]
MTSNLSLYPVGIEEDIIIKIRDVNPHIICSLCFGYFIDATSIVECLHTFCKKCIVKHLQVSKLCPTCNVKAHETQPLLNLRADRTLQDIVYKLVPGLFENEELRREEFYKARGMLMKKQKEGEENLGPKVTTVFNNMNAHSYKFDEQICLCLEKHGSQHIELPFMTYKLRSLEKKFVRCPIRVLVSHLLAVIRKKLDVPNCINVQMLCCNLVLDEDMTMKQIYLMHWYDKPSPMLLFYRLEKSCG